MVMILTLGMDLKSSEASRKYPRNTLHNYYNIAHAPYMYMYIINTHTQTHTHTQTQALSHRSKDANG